MYFLLNMGIFHCYVSLPEGKDEVERQGQKIEAQKGFFEYEILECNFQRQ